MDNKEWCIITIIAALMIIGLLVAIAHWWRALRHRREIELDALNNLSAAMVQLKLTNLWYARAICIIFFAPASLDSALWRLGDDCSGSRSIASTSMSGDLRARLHNDQKQQQAARVFSTCAGTHPLSVDSKPISCID